MAEANEDIPMQDTHPSTTTGDQTPEEEGPSLCRGQSEQLERIENILRDVGQLVKTQREDLMLGPIRKAPERGEGESGDYVLDDQHLLFHAPRGKARAIALPRTLIPGVLALAHGTFGHPGTARTTLIIADKYHWPSLKKDVKAYVLSCRCRMRKKQWSAQLHMLPPRFLRST